ncbi:M23 family metallopeptidase [bacterium 1xD42-62]|uniref:M23 family metallopeptidase n=2 Tax=Parablautia muri TaxID=2320879 RepID=A0A9X5GSC8_9FIRM|nr:M23 family metallopeptidase [Parablautia muri]
MEEKMRRNRRRGLGRERFLMIASAVLVLGSLTATGLWLGRDKSNQGDGYVVDLSAIENSKTAGKAEEIGGETKDVEQEVVTADDLDYDPYFQETNSQKVENPDQSESASMSDEAEQQREEQRSTKSNEEQKQQGDDESNTGEGIAETEQIIEEENTTALSTAMQPALTFSDSDTLIWPVVGNILVNYSMDKTVYFPTLQQYKYNPAIIIQANEGDLITAASAGKVTSVFHDPQIGNGVTMELGGGYEATYGQLANILVSEGSYVAAGDIIAEVAAPTKYYSVEGTNVYFKLTKDGNPLNPLAKLN